jgi:geranylgeranyl pyrophosphate synthase
MNIPLAQVNSPPPVFRQTMRPTQSEVPPTLSLRERLWALSREYVRRERPVPPMPLSEIQVHAERLLTSAGEDVAFAKYVAVLINNEMWRDKLAGVPFERRLLLLPKCLRAEATCPAPFDEFGLLCKQCGQCSLQDLQEEAERLGYAVLIAEGSAIVMAMIETGKIEAIVGVSCISVLEKAFPYMESAAIPGVAIPLLQDDCQDTNVDLQWVWDVVHLTSDDMSFRLDLDEMRREVDSWFEEGELDRIAGPAASETERISRAWLAKAGKRWRPFLTACTYVALRDAPIDHPIPDSVRKIAIAVECFHKASLIHDDIEDADDMRYDSPAVHAEHGVPVALNVGDLLLGDGYRLIAESQSSTDQIALMMKAASAAHRALCIGQGEELCWRNDRRVLPSKEVLNIFRLKTAPAFEVALRLGAIAADCGPEVLEVMERYSANLGIAYQIRDDIDDWTGGDGGPDSFAERPTLLPALAYESARPAEREQISKFWTGNGDGGSNGAPVEIIAGGGTSDRASDLYEAYKEEAVRSLRPLESATLKGLLRRVLAKIFDDLQVEGWCGEFEASNASSIAAGAASAE